MKVAERAFIWPMTRRHVGLRLKIDVSGLLVYLTHMQLTLGISRCTSTERFPPQPYTARLSYRGTGTLFAFLLFAEHSSGSNSVMTVQIRLLPVQHLCAPTTRAVYRGRGTAMLTLTSAEQPQGSNRPFHASLPSFLLFQVVFEIATNKLSGLIELSSVKP
ncbi:hypothetical protein CONLIGDRAFT_468004 [Coniochaeta ligniaria NRRL 30616]|uniref:Uncharacterized protein n=1 Tax=Coniochaeta ligniaria NRRL 30616 TaxID=1408157 RepID=A0A1J7IFT0_9PEZI|nr:hypothetical protein CONLIGDRAFT_468004 [Coniochaeta ligniaria NRRL 30616]